MFITVMNNVLVHTVTVKFLGKKPIGLGNLYYSFRNFIVLLGQIGTYSTYSLGVIDFHFYSSNYSVESLLLFFIKNEVKINCVTITNAN